MTTTSKSNGLAIKAELESRGLRHLEQYFGAWAMNRPQFEAMAHQIRGIDIVAHVDAQAELHGDGRSAVDANYEVEDGIAFIDVVGVFTKYGSSLSAMRRGSRGIRRQVRNAAADGKVRGIMLRFDSPGGSVAGTSDLAADVRDAASVKPVYGYVEDIGASAAYYVASQCTKLYCNTDAIVGSIGVLLVVEDWSEFFAEQGVKVHAIATGKYKGSGAFGTELTDEQKADLQRTVDETFEPFAQAVSAGRKMSRERVSEIADGRVFVGANAQREGLVDEVASIDKAVADLQRQTQSRRETSMTTEQVTTPAEPAKPKAATIHELRSNFPEADAEFREKCLEKDMTLAQAKDLWAEQVTAKNEKLAAEVADLKEKNTELEAKVGELEKQVEQKRRGVQTVGTRNVTAEGSSAEDEVNRRVAERVKAGEERHKAFQAVLKEDKALHEAYREEAKELGGE